MKTNKKSFNCTSVFLFIFIMGCEGMKTKHTVEVSLHSKAFFRHGILALSVKEMAFGHSGRCLLCKCSLLLYSDKTGRFQKELQCSHTIYVIWSTAGAVSLLQNGGDLENKDTKGAVSFLPSCSTDRF